MSLERTVNRGLLRDTVGRVMFCPGDCCGRVLDVRRSVAVWRSDRLVLCACTDCADPVLERVKPETLAALEVLDGRELFGGGR